MAQFIIYTLLIADNSDWVAVHIAAALLLIVIVLFIVAGRDASLWSVYTAM
jgi:hypothetical protein